MAGSVFEFHLYTWKHGDTPDDKASGRVVYIYVLCVYVCVCVLSYRPTASYRHRPPTPLNPIQNQINPPQNKIVRPTDRPIENSTHPPIHQSIVSTNPSIHQSNHLNPSIHQPITSNNRCGTSSAQPSAASSTPRFAIRALRS